MKYFAISLMFLLNNEILSLIALIIISLCFVTDILKERCA